VPASTDPRVEPEDDDGGYEDDDGGYEGDDGGYEGDDGGYEGDDGGYEGDDGRVGDSRRVTSAREPDWSRWRVSRISPGT
jgi:hypothetical protein